MCACFRISDYKSHYHKLILELPTAVRSLQQQAPLFIIFGPKIEYSNNENDEASVYSRLKIQDNRLYSHYVI